MHFDSIFSLFRFHFYAYMSLYQCKVVSPLIRSFVFRPFAVKLLPPFQISWSLITVITITRQFVRRRNAAGSTTRALPNDVQTFFGLGNLDVEELLNVESLIPSSSAFSSPCPHEESQRDSATITIVVVVVISIFNDTEIYSETRRRWRRRRWTLWRRPAGTDRAPPQKHLLIASCSDVFTHKWCIVTLSAAPPPPRMTVRGTLLLHAAAISANDMFCGVQKSFRKYGKGRGICGRTNLTCVWEKETDIATGTVSNYFRRLRIQEQEWMVIIREKK